MPHIIQLYKSPNVQRESRYDIQSINKESSMQFPNTYIHM